MPYIGRGLGPSGAFRILDDISLSSHTSGGFNESRTTFALTVGAASLTVGLPQTLIIAVDGVIQEPGSAYTISGSNIVFTAAPQGAATFWGVELGDVGGIAKSIADGTITTDSLASGVLDTDISSVSGSDDTLASAKSIKTYVDTQVTAQDLDATTDSGTIDIDLDSETLTIAGGEGIDTSASGTTITIAGEEASTSNKGVASFHSDNFAVSSGVVTIKNAGVAIAEIATTSGTAGSDTFLRGDGQWQAAGGGALTLIGTVEASDSATLTVSGLDSTYDTYLILLSDINTNGNGDYIVLQVGTGTAGSPSIDSGSSDYSYHMQDSLGSSSSYAAISTPTSTFIRLANGVGNATREGMGAAIWLHRPGNGSTDPIFSGTTVSYGSYLNIRGGMMFGARNAVIAVTQIRVTTVTTTIASGRLSVYGVAHE